MENNDDIAALVRSNTGLYWHRILGHINFDNMCQTKNGEAGNMDLISEIRLINYSLFSLSELRDTVPSISKTNQWKSADIAVENAKYVSWPEQFCSTLYTDADDSTNNSTIWKKSFQEKISQGKN